MGRSEVRRGLVLQPPPQRKARTPYPQRSRVEPGSTKLGFGGSRKKGVRPRAEFLVGPNVIPQQRWELPIRIPSEAAALVRSMRS